MAQTKTQFGYRRHPDQDRVGTNLAEHAVFVDRSHQATAVVQGKTIKAGWIVLGDGTQIGSLETDGSGQNAVTAPKLDVATMTARIGNVVLHAVPVSGVTGSGF